MRAGSISSQFKLWYEQAGTPELTFEDLWDPAANAYELTVAQQVPPTPGQPHKAPMLMPLAMGLLGADGGELPTRLAGESEALTGTRVLSGGRGAAQLSLCRSAGASRCRRCCAAFRRR